HLIYLLSSQFNRAPQVARNHGGVQSSSRRWDIFRLLNSISVSKIQWRVLPILSTVDMAFEKLKKLTSILISDTSLSYIIGVSSPEMSTMNINNNRFLESLSAEVEEVTDMLHIGANGDHMNIDLPSLRRTQNLSIHNVEQLELGELKDLDKNKFESVQLSKLTKVGGTLSLNNNMNLKNVQVDELDMVDGGLVLANNTHLHNIDFFESLSVIGGALELVGPIKEVKMPSLRLVRGSAKVKSSDEKFSCSTWAKSTKLVTAPTNPESKSTPSEKKVQQESSASRIANYVATIVASMMALVIGI
ncbi:hypothetical protein ACNR90_002805, partial [Candidozyma auris]